MTKLFAILMVLIRVFLSLKLSSSIKRLSSRSSS